MSPVAAAAARALVARDSYDDPTTDSIPVAREQVWTWLGLQIAGQALLFLLLITFLFSRRLKAQRHPIILNFVVTWLLSTIPAQLLLYGGQQDPGSPEPNFYLCLFNASLVSSIPPMESVAFLAVMFQVWSMLRVTIEQRTLKSPLWATVLILASPYVVYVVFTLAIAIIGFGDPVSVQRNIQFSFCTVAHHNIGFAVWGFTVVVVAVTFVLQACIAYMVFKNWRSVRGNKVKADFDAHLLFRAAAFSVYELFMVATCILGIFQDNSVAPKFMEALAPIGVFVILASQPDVMLSWVFCCRAKRLAKEPSPEDPHPQPPMEQQMGGRGDPVTLFEILEEIRMPAPAPGSRVSNYDTTRATFSRPPPSALPSARTIISPHSQMGTLRSASDRSYVASPWDTWKSSDSRSGRSYASETIRSGRSAASTDALPYGNTPPGMSTSPVAGFVRSHTPSLSESSGRSRKISESASSMDQILLYPDDGPRAPVRTRPPQVPWAEPRRDGYV